MRTILVLLLLAGAAEAQQKAVVTIAQPGAYLISTDAAGGISIERVASIAVGGGPVPIPTPDPVPVPVDDRTKLISDLINALPASDARHKTAIKFAGTMRFLADQVTKSTLPPAALGHVWDSIMAVSVPEANWAHVKKAALDGLANCGTPAVCSAALEQYALGAMSTVPNKADPEIVRGADDDEIMAAAEEYGFDWSTILQILLPLLLSLLQKWLSVIEIASLMLFC
jgi:hypothetical protein